MPKTLIDGKEIFYRDLGGGFPILFGHSYLWSSEMWEPQLEELSKKYRCIAPDLWSHGESDLLDAKKYSVEELAADHWKLMQHLKIPEFAVIGLSVGGMWAAHLALAYPKAVKALVLMDTYLGSEPMVTQQKYFKMLDFIEKGQTFVPLLDQIVPLFFSPKTLIHRPHLVQNFRNSLAEIKKEKLAGIVTLGRAIFSRSNLLGQFQSIQQPTLILVGNDDIPRPPKEAEEMARLLPNGTLAIIQDAGHISNLEESDQATSCLARFMLDIH